LRAVEIQATGFVAITDPEWDDAAVLQNVGIETKSLLPLGGVEVLNDGSHPFLNLA